MDNLPNNNINSAYMAAKLHEVNEMLRKNLQTEETQKIERQNAPLVKALQDIVSEAQNQNKMLSEQITLLKEENERQKQEVVIARENEVKAQKEAEKADRRFWISLAISVVSILSSILLGVLV